MNWIGLLNNRRVQIALAVFVLALGLIAWNGLTYGVDFSGGTRFSIQLAEPITDPAQKEKIQNIIQQRLDISGLKDASVRVIGDQLVEAELAETNPQQIEQLERTLLRQGKFESTLDGNVLFTGNEIVDVSRDPQKGYGISKVSDTQYQWIMPFTMSEEAARRFAVSTFHQCTASSFENGRPVYTCKQTYFFIDRPVKTVILFSAEQYQQDSRLLLAGNNKIGIPSQTTMSGVLQNLGAPYLVIDQNGLTPQDQTQLDSYLSVNYNIIASDDISKTITDNLVQQGFDVRRVSPIEGVPFIWSVSGLRQIISLSEDVTNLVPYVETVDSPNLQIYGSLIIRGYSGSTEEAQVDLKSLTTLLETGSLPVSVSQVSKETISPSLGSEFLRTVAIIALLAALGVALFLFIRYKIPSLVLPMFATVVMEAVLTLGVAAVLRIPLDLGALAGIIAAIGYGVDDQIVITDELQQKKGGVEVSEAGSLLSRAKRAFFIVVASAATAIAALAPLILIGPSSGMSKLVGFALTTIIGILVGVLITRPAFNEVAREVIQHLDHHRR